MMSVLVVGVLTGCVRQDRGDHARSIDSTTTGFDSAPALPEPIGRSDSLLNTIAPRLEPWVAMWEGALPGFQLDSLYRAGVFPALRNVPVQPLRDFEPRTPSQAALFDVLGARSPDGRFHLVFDSYQEIEGDHGEIEIGGEPDSAPLLLDLRNRTATRFESCGTPCGFHYGVWLSPTHFALAGWQEVDPAGAWKQGRLWIYSLDESTSTRYVTKPIETQEFERYLSTWKQWVSDRYRSYRQSVGDLQQRP